MTPEALAEMLDGREYGNEITVGECRLAGDHGLVVVFGASDDLVELRGAIYDEVGAYGGTVFRVNTEGLLPDWRQSQDSEEDAEDYFRRKRLPSAEIEAVWAGGAPPWTIRTTLPHAPFMINEDGEPFSRGVVFRLADVGASNA